jgi:two-component system, chemotaxis family, response regulator WspR
MSTLLVEADPVVRDALRQHLRANDHDVVTAGSGEAALCLVRDRAADFDLVILDLDLTDRDGYSVCRRISAVLPDVPIVTCSANPDEATVVAAFEAGAVDFVAKPFRPGELVVRTRSALRLREERRRRREHERRLVVWARQLEKSNRDLESTVCIDQLTGIANRRHFDNLLRAEWRRATRDHTELSLVLLDLDDFHAFNDRYGHVGGDACLARIAKALAHCLRRASDVLARYGGEELVAILPETDAVGACVVAERLRLCVEELAIPHAGSRCGSVVTLSAGVATLRPTANATPESLVSNADAALFRAKHDGRNRCRADAVQAEDVVVSRLPWPACPVEVAAPILVQRVPKLLDALRREVDPARQALRAGEFARLTSVGQQVRRTSTQLGFDQLVDIGGQLATAADREDQPAATAALDELAWYLQHVQVVYRRPAQERCDRW